MKIKYYTIYDRYSDISSDTATRHDTVLLLDTLKIYISVI